MTIVSFAAGTPASGGLPPPGSPNAPSAPGFSDMLASAASSLAAFALLPTSAGDALSGIGNMPVPKKAPNTDNAAVPIALPAPVQPPPPASPDADASSAAPSQAASSQTQPVAAATTQTAGGSTGTAGTSNGSAQTTNGVALPSTAAELGTRVALGAQALLSQPSQVLVTLPHGALQAASPALTPNLTATAHGATALDPTTMLPKAASNAAASAATPSATPAALDAVVESATAQSAASSATAGEDTPLVGSTDNTDQAATDSVAGTVPTAVPLPAAEAAAIDTAPPPAVAASALDQVAASLTQGSKLGLSQIEIQLKPAALGTVDVKLELTHDGRVAAVISADRSDTLMQLQRGSGELQQALRDAGLQTDSGSLSFNLRGDAQTSDQSGRQPSYAGAQAVSGDASDDSLAMPAAIAGAGQSSHSGLLNIQV